MAEEDREVERREPVAWAGRGAFTRAMSSTFLVTCGVILPLVALFVELASGMSTEVFIDPLPTPWHIAYVGLVPVSALAAVAVSSPSRRQLRWLSVLNGAALGVAAFYSVLFAPMLPIAVIAILYAGLGLLPLAPVLSLLALLGVQRRLQRRGAVLGVRRRFLGPVLAGFAAALLGPVVLGLSHNVTELGLEMATSDEEASARRGVDLLRAWPDHGPLLEACYDRRRGGFDLLSLVMRVRANVSSEEARKVYYRVTGTSFNSVPPPRRFREQWNTAPRFGWDRPRGGLFDPAQGTDEVAGRVTGLELAGSRLDATLDASEATAYSEWTLVFANGSEVQREARGVVLLPPGGVVSRLTLWVDGEEREAAFSERGRVVAAYTSVVARRRDPVLVTTCGPDRVLVQCFPVPPGGEMRVRVGITSPLAVPSGDRAVYVPPRFIERNFGGAGVRVDAWLQTRDEVLSLPDDLTEQPGPEPGMVFLRGELPVGVSAPEPPRVELARADAPSIFWAPVIDGEGIVQQSLERAPAEGPERLAIVIDGSVSLAPHVDVIADALEEGLPEGMPVSLWFAGDEVEELRGDGEWTIDLDALRDRDLVGGRDPVPALHAAARSLPTGESTAVLWLHGPQPVTLETPAGLRLTLEKGSNPVRIVALEVAPGPNEVLAGLCSTGRLEVAPRAGALGDDLDALVESWWGSGGLVLARTRLDGAPSDGAPRASSHVSRLWALDAVNDLLAGREPDRRERARELAASHQLVTIVTGAVVLETEAQYRASGLSPVDAATVPSVPEPGTWALIVVCFLVLGAAHLMRRQRLGPAG
jgi:hypothetical protein